jgi:gliding motility-associated-like protein
MANFTAFTPGPVSYLWDFGDGNLLSTTSSNISHQYTSFGNFIPKVILTDPTGCLIPVTGAAAINVIGANAKFGWDKTLFCDSGYVHFTDSTISNDLIINYNWNFGDGSTSNLQIPTHQYTSPGIYSISLDVLTQSGCRDTAIATQVIKVVQSPLISITGDSTVCLNGSMVHNGVFLRTDTSIVNWQWNFPNGNQSISQNPSAQTYTTAGNFIVTSIATNSSGCSDTITKNIVVYPLPVITISGTITMIAGYPVQIPATYSSNVVSWAWTPSVTLNCSTCPQPEASPKFNTTYTVNVTDSNGCRNSASVDIIVICKNANVFVPNTFSPNGDGSNDVFYPRGHGINRVKSLRIYNRWGEMVFDKNDFPINDPSSGWDGTYKGRKPVADVYVYQVEIYCDNGDIIHFDGNISLIL